MHQVDDFAIATQSKEIAQEIITEINKHLRLPIHILWVSHAVQWHGCRTNETFCQNKLREVHQQTYKKLPMAA
jgi:hypothetical protein